MLPTMNIKPAITGQIIRDPETRLPLAETGEAKPMTSFWLARRADGSVVEYEPAAEAPMEKPAPAAKRSSEP